MMKSGLGNFAIALILLTPGWALSQNPAAAAPELTTTIEHLINYVDNSGFTFVRNGEKRDAHAAAEHIRSKYNQFKKSIATPEQFIEKCASKSLMSGDEYLVVLSDGSEKKVRDWLFVELSTFRGKAAGG